MPTGGTDLKCDFCGEPSMFLCDHVISHDRLTGSKTCDKRMCGKCRYMASSVMLCYRPRSGGLREFTVDYCPDHRPKQ